MSDMAFGLIQGDHDSPARSRNAQPPQTSDKGATSSESYSTPSTSGPHSLHTLDMNTRKFRQKDREPTSDDLEPWLLTVVLLEGLRLMRPEKAWRPIVTIEVDNHHVHETTLGVDGQCVNQREIFRFSNVTPSSQVEVKIHHRSQGKKKAKRRHLVASASHCLGELLKKREGESRVDVRLQCHTASKGTTSSRGRPQNGAVLRLRLRPPLVNLFPLEPPDCDLDVPILSIAGSSDGTSSCPSSPCRSEHLEPLLDDPPSQIRKRRVRGYAVDSDDELYSSDASRTSQPKLFSQSDTNTNSHTYIGADDEDNEDDPYFEPRVIKPTPQGHTKSIGWIAASLLPTYTEKVAVPPPLNRAESMMASMTMYSELKTACVDSHYDQVFKRLQMEWTYIGGLLVALAAVDTAVFSISPDGLFTVDSYARIAIAASSVASGLGIACDAWFLLRYNWADLNTFKSRAKDIYGSYFFFALSSRVPALCMFISALSLMGFLALVAFNVWPQGVLGVCFIVGVIMSLQFWVFGAHWCATKVVDGGRAGTRGIGRVVRSMTL